MFFRELSLLCAHAGRRLGGLKEVATLNRIFSIDPDSSSGDHYKLSVIAMPGNLVLPEM